MRERRRKLVGWGKLLRERASWRRAGRRVVFTNGVFDILHAGHVRLLERSRALGDVLVVGMNSDKSTRKLKGPSRPVNRQADRAALLAALACVDRVVVFGQATPRSLLERLRPDVLVKGADYKRGEIAGREFAGRVARIVLKRGFSTTGLIRRLAGKAA